MAKSTQPKISSKWSLFIASILGIVSSLIIIVFFLGLPGQGSSAQQNLIGTSLAQPVALSESTGLALPIRLKIPGINVNAVVEYVGLTPDGLMDVPKGPDGVAWFKLGPRPGENGSAVIAGHYGWKNKIPAVFDNLHKLQKGDKLYIEDAFGAITTFVVRESRSYEPNADATDVFTSNDGKSHLNLVTCEGVWNKTQQSYSKRRVIFTDKEI